MTHHGMGKEGRRGGQALPREHFSSDHSPVAWDAPRNPRSPWQSQAQTGHWPAWALDTCPPGGPARVLPHPLAFPQPQGPPSSALYTHACTVATASHQVHQPLPTCAPAQPATRLRKSHNPFLRNPSGTQLPCPLDPCSSSAWPQPLFPACPVVPPPRPPRTRPGIKHYFHL